jgi:gliding motility-associated-like protein
MKRILTLLFSIFNLNCFAQILSPDTVCVGVPVNFTTSLTAVTYSWDFSSVSVVQPISPISTLYGGPGLNTPGVGCLAKDSGNFYYFAPNYNTQEIVRINFGNSIHNAPVVTNLGSFGMTAGLLDGIDVVKDTISNQWYALAVNWGQLLVLSFGSSLSNTPTSILTSYPSIHWGHQITIKRYHGNWSAFLANRNSNITRFDFGSSLTNPPTVIDIPNVGGVTNPSSFSLYEQLGNWYMLIPSLITGNLSRYNFGTNLLNNTPTGVSLGNPGGLFNIPRPIHLLTDCQNHLIAYVDDENGRIIKLDFAGDITNTPIATDLGFSGMTENSSLSPVSFSDTLGFICSDAALNKLWIYYPMTFSAPSYINYYNPNQTYTFPTTGIYHVSLFCDLAYCSGPSAFCKDIVVVPGFSTSTSKDTSVCTSLPLVLHASVTGSHVWNTGDTTSSVSVTTSGTYWVRTNTGPCVFKSDTIHVTYTGGLPINLGNDTAFCVGHNLILSPSVPAGASLIWSTGATGSSITVNTTGTYWVKVSSVDGGCTGSDTIKVVVNPLPLVDLGPDKKICAGSPVTLQSSDSYISPTYLWSTGSSAYSITTTAANVYWLKVTVAGCIGFDTVNIVVTPNPEVYLGSDTAICSGTTITLKPTEPSGAQYSWSIGSSSASIEVSNPGMYKLVVTINGCSTADSINITQAVMPSIKLGPDTSLCAGDVFLLNSNDSSTVWSTGYKGNSISVSEQGVYWATVTGKCGSATDSINVDYHICDIWFPSAFTPNRDGLNDIAKVVGSVKYFDDFSLSIYNRFGQRVFHTLNIYKGWDGTLNGVNQDLGTYYYMIFYSLEGKKHMLKGDLQLIR